jgi:hypothetical protein
MAAVATALAAVLAAAQESDRVTARFHPTDEIIANPERGLWAHRDLCRVREFGDLFARGHRVVHGLVSLKDFRDRPLSPELLRSVSDGLDAARRAGLKVLVRFNYDFTQEGRDAPLERVLEHIGQLAPCLRAHEDVIAAMEAGFIGAWGEWHSSKHGLDQPGPRRRILEALLEALPRSRMVAIRTPRQMQEIFGAEPPPEAEAYGGGARARVGHHNDCFLADEHDAGTYFPGPVEPWKKFTEAWTRTALMCGETCRRSPPRSDGKTALAELARFHWSLLHEEYHPDVIRAWRAQGVFDEIRRRLGYRFVLVEASWPRVVRRGGTAAISMRLRNEGFASPFNARPLWMVLRQGAWRGVLEAKGDGTDPRRWWAGAESVAEVRVAIPADAPTGAAVLALWMPDACASIRDRPEYAIRLANEGVWDAATGENVLTQELKVEP